MRWRSWFRSPRDGEIDEELASHLEMAIRDRVSDGEPPDAARREALLEFGSPALAREATRSVWSWTMLEQLATDLQIGVRILWRAPALSLTAVLLTALVIGGNTTIFSMVHAVLTKPAPGVVADRLVTLGWVANGEEHPASSYANYLDVATATHTLSPLLAVEFQRFILTTNDGSYAIEGAAVSTNYFDTLAIRPPIGRTFDDAEARAGAGLAAVISDRLWRDRFAAAPDIVGRTVTLNGHAASIIGVAPARFRGVAFGEATDVWMPIEAYAAAEGRVPQLRARRGVPVVMIGRLAANVTLSRAQSELATMAQRLPPYPGEPPATNRTIQLFAYSGTAAGDSLVAQRGPWFLALFSVITVLTLLIVCANVANLMLARAVVRAREMAVRQSFGASRTRIVRIFVAEGLAIGMTAWAAAAVFAFWTTTAIPRLIPPLDNSSSRIVFDFTPDWQVLGYAMLLALVGTVIVSAAPAVRTFRQDLQPLLKAGEQGVVQGRSSVSSALVVLQLAFSVLLLVVAGLAYRSLGVLDASDLGFNKDNLLLVTVNTKAAAPTPDANAQLLGRMLDRLATVRGVTAASYAWRPVQSFWPPERIPVDGGTRTLTAERNEVGAGYLHLLGVTPIAGRDFVANEPGAGGIPAIVNQRLAAALWPGLPPVGRTLRLASYSQPLVIVGVAPNAFYSGYRRERDANAIFVSPVRSASQTGEVTIYVRYAAPLDDVAPAVARVLRDVDDRAPIVYQRTMDDQLLALTWPIQALAVLLASFAAVSLLIAAIGQYAAVAFTMRRRIRDFGVRIALGASARDIIASVLREGLVLTAVGVAIGAVLSIVTATGLRSLLYGVSATDARTYAGVLTLLGAASLIACYLPARRAAAIDPMQALRDE